MQNRICYLIPTLLELQILVRKILPFATIVSLAIFSELQGPSLIINLAQLVSPSVALPAELVLFYFYLILLHFVLSLFFFYYIFLYFNLSYSILFCFILFYLISFHLRRLSWAYLYWIEPHNYLARLVKNKLYKKQ